MSQSMLARMLDIHPSTIPNWMRRESFPDLANALRRNKKRDVLYTLQRIVKNFLLGRRYTAYSSTCFALRLP